MLASITKPSGKTETWSPWLIHTVCLASKPFTSGLSFVKERSALPYSRVCAFNFTVQLMSNKLHAVANPQNSNPKSKICGSTAGAPSPYTLDGPPGEHNTLRLKLANFLNRSIERQQFALHPKSTNSSSNQLVVLASKI